MHNELEVPAEVALPPDLVVQQKNLHNITLASKPETLVENIHEESEVTEL